MDIPWKRVGVLTALLVGIMPVIWQFSESLRVASDWIVVWVILLVVLFLGYWCIALQLRNTDSYGATMAKVFSGLGVTMVFFIVLTEALFKENSVTTVAWVLFALWVFGVGAATSLQPIRKL